MTDISRLPGPFELAWDWQLEAACRGTDSSLFFHPSGERGGPHDRRENAAKRVCARCPVRARCLEYALDAREPYGVWGGLTEDERYELLRPRRERARRERVREARAGRTG
ncbi:WhiB family transcriptional regulator [Kitasatospora sp. NPDC048540]|uniref:WhiB family transcriptional regulator n=1 Tax=unclassified Kitasatospora TaxID=2633591 RepID=UPI0006901E1A|nr:WhiB family transcriptional regulator [Kitasatospora sp. MBT63]